MDRPTAEDIRAWSKLDFASYDYPAPTPPDADPLQLLVDQAIAYVVAVTGRPLDATMPGDLAPLAEQAVRMRVEQLVIGGQAETVEEAAEALADAGIQSFSVPGYSETRFRPESSEVYKRLNWWPSLAELLYLLMTDEKREDFDARVAGYHAPGFAVTEVDWADVLPTTPPDPFDPWPLGWY